MKKLYYSVFTAVIFQFGLYLNAIGQETCPGDMQHYWKFEERDSSAFLDHIGNLNANILVATTRVDGIVDSAQRFSANSQVNIPDHASLDWSKNSSFTVEFWVNKSSPCPSVTNDNNNVIIGRDDATTELHWWIGISCANPGKVNFTLLANNGQGQILDSKTGIIDGNWHHIAVVRDGGLSTTSIYIDGLRDTTITYSYTDGFSSLVPINVGWLNIGTKYHFSGILDELAMHNAAMSQAEIIKHYNSGIGKTYCTKVATPVIRPIADDYRNFNVYPTTVRNNLNVYLNLQKSQPVSISMYDLSGKKILSLLESQLGAGEHHFRYDISKSALHASSNTMVIVRIQTNDQTESRKVLLNIQ